jgi:fatty-acyl-CoA synthase
MEMTMSSLTTLLKRQASQSPDATYVVHLASGTSISYAQLLDTAERLSFLLASLGVGKRDKVAFVVRNHWLVFPLLLACTARRATLVPIDPELHRDELAFILGDAAAALAIHIDGVTPPGLNGMSRSRSLGDFLGAVALAVRPTTALEESVASDVALMF